jgi:hypothetical protein
MKLGESKPEPTCEVCYDTTFDGLVCGRRTEQFSRCYVCHEPISWDPDDPDKTPERDPDTHWWEVERRGACRCGSEAWSFSACPLGSGYNYEPTSHVREGLGLVRQDAAGGKLPTMARRAALGLIARDWIRRALLGIAGVAVFVVVLLAVLNWQDEIPSFLAHRPSRWELFWWCFVIWWATQSTRHLELKARLRKIARRRMRRKRARKAAWAALRGPRATTPSDVAASRGQA